MLAFCTVGRVANTAEGRFYGVRNIEVRLSLQRKH